MSRASIIIPVRNDVPRLTKLLGSFSPQDWEDHEILVIDDCSTDDTPKVAAGFPVRVVSLERRCGPSVARNHGAKLAHEDVDKKLCACMYGCAIYNSLLYAPSPAFLGGLTSSGPSGP